METLTSRSDDDTARLAARLAAGLRFDRPRLLLLQGPLGAGKTLFARALIRALCSNPALEVPSPTFTLVQTYDMPAGTLWHFDLYRLERPEDVYELGWEEALSAPLCLVEWPERLGSLCPAGGALITFSVAAAGQRHIAITGLAG